MCHHLPAFVGFIPCLGYCNIVVLYRFMLLFNVCSLPLMLLQRGPLQGTLLLLFPFWIPSNNVRRGFDFNFLIFFFLASGYSAWQMWFLCASCRAHARANQSLPVTADSCSNLSLYLCVLCCSTRVVGHKPWIRWAQEYAAWKRCR